MKKEIAHRSLNHIKLTCQEFGKAIGSEEIPLSVLKMIIEKAHWERSKNALADDVITAFNEVIEIIYGRAFFEAQSKQSNSISLKFIDQVISEVKDGMEEVV